MKWALGLFVGSFVVETALGWTYHHSNRKMKWSEARRFCQDNYTDMVVIQSQEENDYLVSQLPTRSRSPYYWIGITKNQKEDPWTWIGNNSTWIGEQSWATNEPNNNDVTEFCVEIYVNHGKDRGKWNDEKCGSRKYPVCYQAQCNETSCVRGRCWETINNTTCICEAGFEGDMCEKAIINNETEEIITEISDSFDPANATMEPGANVTERPSLYGPDNGHLNYKEGNGTFNSSCQFKCYLGYFTIGSLPCGVTGARNGTKPSCSTYKLSVVTPLGGGAFSTICFIGFCCMKHRKRKKLAQTGQAEESTIECGYTKEKDDWKN